MREESGRYGNRQMIDRRDKPSREERREQERERDGKEGEVRMKKTGRELNWGEKKLQEEEAEEEEGDDVKTIIFSGKKKKTEGQTVI